MGLKTFLGGVHPFEGKELAEHAPIKEILPKGQMVYPLSQHIGAPATPIVAVGDSVKKGQKIAEAGGFVSAPIYASVSGTVKAIEPRRVAVGDKVNSIVIDNDGIFEEVEYTAVADVATLTKEERKQLIKENPAYGNIICRCEMISEGEILDAIHRPLGARSLDGVKRRTRAGMGRCQAGFCSPRTMEILAREVPMAMEEITKNGGKSTYIVGTSKNI